MRSALFAGLALLLAPLAGPAQTGPYLGVVIDPEVKLRAGPSDQFPETATLPKGTAVVVDHEEPNGWLAVHDAPGKVHSISWVPAAFIDFDNTKPTPQNVVVSGEVKLAPGQLGLAQPLAHIRRASVPEGTILTVIGAKVQFEGKWWHPVSPPAGDFRYLPKQAVKFDRPANTNVTVREVAPPPPDARPAAPVASLPGPGASSTLPSGPTTTAGKPAVSHPLWAQAETAEREGRFDDAEKLFFQLARVMNEPGGDHDIANLCYTRIHSLREKKRSGSVVASPEARPAASTTTKPATAGTPVGVGPPVAAASEPKDDRARWTGPGKLVRSGLALDGRKTYALESNGVTVMYVVAAPGVDLDRHVNKKVDIFGSTYNRRDLQKPYVVATAVEVQ